MGRNLVGVVEQAMYLTSNAGMSMSRVFAECELVFLHV